MRHLILLLATILFFSCVTIQNEFEDDGIPLSQTDVRLEFYKNEPNADEIKLTYYDNANNIDVTEIITFEYDTNGDALPHIIYWNDYGYKVC